MQLPDATSTTRPVTFDDRLCTNVYITDSHELASNLIGRVGDGMVLPTRDVREGSSSGRMIGGDRAWAIRHDEHDEKESMFASVPWLVPTDALSFYRKVFPSGCLQAAGHDEYGDMTGNAIAL